jgi:uridine kinase
MEFKKRIDKPKVLVIAIGGGTCSGKTCVAKKIYELLKSKNIKIALLSQDKFYKTLGKNIDPLIYNFDIPPAFDVDSTLSTLISIKNRKVTNIPDYDYEEHKQTTGDEQIHDVDIIIFEGILALHFDSLRDMMDLKIFIDTPSDIRLIRRIRRDVEERGRDVEGILIQYERTVRDAHEKYIEPSKAHADLIIPMGKENHASIKIAVSHIETLYNKIHNKN